MERITITEITEGVENRNNWLEIRFGYNDDQIQYIEKTGIYTENIEGEEIQRNDTVGYSYKLYARRSPFIL